MTVHDICDVYRNNFRKLPIYVAQFIAHQLRTFHREVDAEQGRCAVLTGSYLLIFRNSLLQGSSRFLGLSKTVRFLMCFAPTRENQQLIPHAVLTGWFL
jgi:hypothetical protein